jgi:hypothetical protein
MATTRKQLHEYISELEIWFPPDKVSSDNDFCSFSCSLTKYLIYVYTEAFLKNYLELDIDYQLKYDDNNSYGLNLLFHLESDRREKIFEQYKNWFSDNLTDNYIQKITFDNGYINILFTDIAIISLITDVGRNLLTEKAKIKYNHKLVYSIKTKEVDWYEYFGGEKAWNGLSKEQFNNICN